MNSEGLLNKSWAFGISGCSSAPRPVCNVGLRASDRKANCKIIATVDSSTIQSDPLSGRILCTLLLDNDGAVKEQGSEDIAFCATTLTTERKQTQPAVSNMVQTCEMEDRGGQERSCTRGGSAEVRCQHSAWSGLHARTSSHIPVPVHRAHREVMAAAALTSLCTTGPPRPEPPARESSDQSVPSTPSPPLSTDISKGFLLLSQGDDVTEESEITHFLFEDPIPRKRRNSMKVMFKCLWKNCETVLSSSSGIQRHVRTIHLGRNGDSEDSEGEEDFYYSEMEVNMDTLSEGLSCLTPTSPTMPTAPPLPTVISLRAELRYASPLSQSAPSALCHIRTDHAYQATAPLSSPTAPSMFGPNKVETNFSWQPPPTAQSTQIHLDNMMERRLQHTSGTKLHPTATPTPKPSSGNRKPRGEAKKCRKVYGMEKRELWCTACRWKKACQRFTD
ncbi:hypothetical protein AAFF_G00145220 [Aldrovandia affinis]|uniref:C2H2-type domain-containing protein n=1 Tax=Aldrovandia affinis TaxID=143900 RepID=A0AAD7T101_9TELE|nr:hypothetical protein AAFF_G00145220 [Aldrovandia affinis]